MTYRKKLIEVALPLEEINEASAREKSIRHGHPSTLHLWWARRPLATCRAVIFASIIDDPGEEGVPPELLSKIDQLPLARKYAHLATEDPVDEAGQPLEGEPAKKEKKARERRYKLFTFIEKLVQWESTNNRETIRTAQDLILAATDGKPPALHDPFCGGGSIPLEAQRLGLEAYGTDLNPVAVLITKAMIEIPPKFAGRPPVNPDWQTKSAEEKHLHHWEGAQGLAEDVRYYGKWMRDEAKKRIGHLYPKIEITEEMAVERPDLKPYVGKKLTVIAWLWARTVKSPNPAYAHVEVPLASSFLLSPMLGKEAYVEPEIQASSYRFRVKAGKPTNPTNTKNGTKAGGSHSAFLCLMSGTPISFEYIREEGEAGRIGARSWLLSRKAIEAACSYRLMMRWRP
jgi:putative DNA methylase